jgi:hypothetical protein
VFCDDADINNETYKEIKSLVFLIDCEAIKENSTGSD